MTEILCKWLNDEVHVEPKLSKCISVYIWYNVHSQPVPWQAGADLTFADKVSNGYLFGQILYKHDMQPDFCLFSKGK